MPCNRGLTIYPGHDQVACKLFCPDRSAAAARERSFSARCMRAEPHYTTDTTRTSGDAEPRFRRAHHQEELVASLRGESGRGKGGDDLAQVS